MSPLDSLCEEIEDIVTSSWKQTGAPTSAFSINRIFTMGARRRCGLGMKDVVKHLLARGVIERRYINQKMVAYYAPRELLHALSHEEQKMVWIATSHAHMAQHQFKNRTRGLATSVKSRDRSFKRRFTKSRAEIHKELKQIESITTGTYTVYSSHPDEESKK